MLVRFAIDADSLAPDQQWTPAYARQCHVALFATWRSIGLLVHDGESFEASQLMQAVKVLSPKLRPLWMEALEHCPVDACRSAWAGRIRKTNAMDLTNVQVGLVDDACAEAEFDFSDDQLACGANEIHPFELCRLASASQAAAFSAATKISGSHIETQDTFRTIWDQRFHGLAAAPIKSITVVDRFAFSQHYECPHDQLSGLSRFLVELDRSATGPRHVTLFSAWTAELMERVGTDWTNGLSALRTEVVDAIAPKLLRKNVKRLRIVMLPNGPFGLLHHDRYVRFGEYVLDVGTGLKVLQGAHASERSSMALKTGTQLASYKNAESEIVGHVLARSIEILL